MRAFVTASLTVALSLTAFAAKAQIANHRLLAYTHPNPMPGVNFDVSLPETKVSGVYSLVDRPGAQIVWNRAFVDSDTGRLGIASTLKSVNAGGEAEPQLNNWNIVASLDQAIKPKTPGSPSGAKFHLPRPLEFPGIITTPNAGHVTLRATLEVQSTDGSCKGIWLQDVASVNQSPQPVPGYGTRQCDYPPEGWSIVIDPESGISIDVPDIKQGVKVQAVYQMEFENLKQIDSLEVGIDGALTMVTTGGGAVGTSPTFLTKTETADGGDSDAGGGTTTPIPGQDSGVINPNVSPSASPPSDDGGCNASGVSGAPFGLLFAGAALGVVLKRRKAKR